MTLCLRSFKNGHPIVSPSRGQAASSPSGEGCCPRATRELAAATNAIPTGFVPVTIPIWVAGYDLAGQIGVALVMPLSGIAFDDQIFSFDVTQAAQLGEKRAPCAPPPPPVSVR